MSLTLAAAAAAVNVNKTTLLRAIKAGKVSGNRDERGQWHIDAAELHRVYPPAGQRCDVEAPQRDAVALAMAASEAEIAGLRQVAELLRAQLQETRTDRGSRG
jgi:hypothetical protein